jgi:hypothetical protein
VVIFAFSVDSANAAMGEMEVMEMASATSRIAKFMSEEPFFVAIKCIFQSNLAKGRNELSDGKNEANWHFHQQLKVIRIERCDFKDWI